MTSDNELQVQTVITCCEEKLHVARELISKDDGERREMADRIAAAYENLDGSHQLIRLNLKEYTTFADMLHSMLMQLFDSSNFDISNLSVTREEVEDEYREGQCCFLAECIFFSDLPEENVHVMLLLENYEVSADVWNASNYSWMRALMCEASTTAITLISDRTASEVSELPVGSSPFYNIFSKDGTIIE